MVQVFKAVVEETGVEAHRLAGGNRFRTSDVSLARALFVGVCREVTDRSYPRIARYLVLKSHGSCIDQHHRYQALLATGEWLELGGTMSMLRVAVLNRVGIDGESGGQGGDAC